MNHSMADWCPARWVLRLFPVDPNMIKVLAFFLGINCLVGGWVGTGLLLLYIVFFEEFKE